MTMKKKAASLFAALALVACSSFTVFAAYPTCPVEGCNMTQAHVHDNATYCGHYLGDGHTYHQVCSVVNCTETGVHEHDGVSCFGHYAQDGHSYHRRGGCHGGGHHGGRHC